MARLSSEWFGLANTSTIGAILESPMRVKLFLSLFASAYLCAVAMCQEQPAAVISPSTVASATYITHVTVIDTENGKKIQDRTVIISGDRIWEVSDGK